jgi:hypothetical protein
MLLMREGVAGSGEKSPAIHARSVCVYLLG